MLSGSVYFYSSRVTDFTIEGQEFWKHTSGVRMEMLPEDLESIVIFNFEITLNIDTYRWPNWLWPYN